MADNNPLRPCPNCRRILIGPESADCDYCGETRKLNILNRDLSLEVLRLKVQLSAARDEVARERRVREKRTIELYLEREQLQQQLAQSRANEARLRSALVRAVEPIEVICASHEHKPFIELSPAVIESLLLARGLVREIIVDTTPSEWLAEQCNKAAAGELRRYRDACNAKAQEGGIYEQARRTAFAELAIEAGKRADELEAQCRVPNAGSPINGV